MTKTQRTKLLDMATKVLYARRNGKVAAEQAAIDNLADYCHCIGLDTHPINVIEQAKNHLLRTSVAAGMNGLV